MGARRYRVLDPPDRQDPDQLLEQLQEESFREPLSRARGGETRGWVSLHNLIITDFVRSDCLYNNYLCFALRVDNKKIPPRLLSALLDLKMKDWLQASGRDRVPGVVKGELKEQLELELFPRQLPAVAVYDVSWDLHRQEVWFFANGNRANETFRELFLSTFGLVLRPVGPVELLLDHREGQSWLNELDRIGQADLRPEVRR